MKKAIIIGSIVLIVGGLAATGLYLYNQSKLIANLKYSLGKPSVNNLGISSADISLPIVIANTSDFPLTLNSISVAISVNGVPVTNVSLPSVQTVAPRASTTIKTSLKFNPATVLGNALGGSIIGSLDGLADLSNIVIKSVGNINATVGKNLIQQNVPVDDTQTLAQAMA